MQRMVWLPCTAVPAPPNNDHIPRTFATEQPPPSRGGGALTLRWQWDAGTTGGDSPGVCRRLHRARCGGAGGGHRTKKKKKRRWPSPIGCVQPPPAPRYPSWAPLAGHRRCSSQHRCRHAVVPNVEQHLVTGGCAGGHPLIRPRKGWPRQVLHPAVIENGHDGSVRGRRVRLIPVPDPLCQGDVLGRNQDSIPPQNKHPYFFYHPKDPWT